MSGLRDATGLLVLSRSTLVGLCFNTAAPFSLARRYGLCPHYPPKAAVAHPHDVDTPALTNLIAGSILMAALPFQLPAPQSGTLSQILSGTRPSMQTVSDVCLRRICLIDTSALSMLEVF